jgi:acetyltransferase-like isoleucine patch superfamily enzyme
MIKSLIFFLGKLYSYIFPQYIQNKLKATKQLFFSGYKSRIFQTFGKNVSLGRNTTYIGEKYISIGDNTSIGDNGRLTAYGYYEKTKQHFTPLLTIGNNCNIGEQSHITAINCIMIGNNVLTGPRVLITDNAHGDSLFKLLDTAPTERFLYSKGKVVIEDNVWIAEGAMIMPGVRIGKGSIIAANSVVTKDIPPYSVAAGTPAKIIKTMK